MDRFTTGPLFKRRCYIVVGFQDDAQHIEEVPGYEFTLYDNTANKEYKLWAVKNCGMWNVTSPLYGLATTRQNYKTRKAAIDSFLANRVAQYVKLVDDRAKMLYSGRDELHNRFKSLLDEFEKGRS